MRLLVKNVKIKFGSKGFDESKIETRMTQIEEMFSESSKHEFRTISKICENKNHSRIDFEFEVREGIDLIFVIKMLVEWQKEKIINVKYTPFCKTLEVRFV